MFWLLDDHNSTLFITLLFTKKTIKTNLKTYQRFKEVVDLSL